MSLLFLVGELHTGGLERQLFYLLKAMDRDRFAPAVAVWNYRETDVHVAPIRALGVPIYPMPSGGSRLGKLIAFRRVVEQLQPDVVHSYAFYTNFAASWGALGNGAIAIGSVRSAFDWAKKDAGALVGRLSARWPAHQIFNSRSAVEDARRTGAVFAPRTAHFVRNGLDLDRFQPAAGSPDVPFRILGVGYLLPVKRWERLLAVAQYLDTHGVDARIRIAGDGPLRSSLAQEAVRLGVADRVEFLPHSEDVPGLLAQSSILVHTSDSEGCPNAVMEAMACGRPVVATDVGDVSSLVEHGRTGFIAPADDGRMLAQHVVTLVRDPELRRRMGAAARIVAERDFGLDRLVRETLAVYEAAGWTHFSAPLGADPDVRSHKWNTQPRAGKKQGGS